MKNFTILFFALVSFSGLLKAQNGNDGSLISNDSLIQVVPGGADIQGVVQGTCRTIIFEITNIGLEELSISALFLDDAAGTDDFELVNPMQVPFVIDTSNSFNIRIDYCPNNPGIDNSRLMIEYDNGKVLKIPISGTPAVIYDMDYCQDFNDSPTGDALPNGGWTGDSKNSSSIYIGCGSQLMV